MSTVTTTLLTGSQAISNFDLSKIFVYNNRYQTETIVNDDYNPMTLYAGTVMGRIAGNTAGYNGKGVVFPSTASSTNGTQYPIGILASDCVIADGDTLNVPICVAGDVVEDKIIFWNAPTDTIKTVISGREYYDRIQADSVGIKIVASTENTYVDNQ